MEFNLTTKYKLDKNYDLEKIKLIKKLNDMYLKESYKGNKVAYYYENIYTGDIISYNSDICFYAASTIKILVCLILFLKAEKNEINLDEEILITMNDLKQDTGIIKYQKKDTFYTILELIRLTIVESDNTSYIKLVDLVGKNKIKDFGLSIGAIHTMEGKDTDSFGIINCNDMIIYWKEIKKYIDRNTYYSNLFKKYLSNPSFKIVNTDLNFIRKYGSWDIAYHEAGYIENKNPFYMIILTQLNRKKYKKTFINKTANLLLNINKI